MTSDEIIQNFNAAVELSRKNLAYLVTVPLWEIALQAAKQTELAEQTLELQKAEIDYRLADPQPGKRDADSERGTISTLDYMRARIVQLINGNNEELERRRTVEAELSETRDLVTALRRLLSESKGRTEAAEQEIKILRFRVSRCTEDVASCLRSCEQTIRENAMDGDQAAGYLRAYANTISATKIPESNYQRSPNAELAELAPESGSQPKTHNLYDPQCPCEDCAASRYVGENQELSPPQWSENWKEMKNEAVLRDSMGKLDKVQES